MLTESQSAALRGHVVATMPTAAFDSGLTDVDPAQVDAEARRWMRRLAPGEVLDDGTTGSLGLGKVRAWLATRHDAPQGLLFARALRSSLIEDGLRVAVGGKTACAGESP